jgi:hypothetical protein
MRSIRRVATGVAMMAALLPNSARVTHAAMGSRGPITVAATAGGLRLSLVVPRRTYPRNALTMVTVRLRNVSHHVVMYDTTGVALPGVSAPQVEVLNRSGRALFPPALPDMPVLNGPPAVAEPLRPGQVLFARLFIIVRGARIRATVAFVPRSELQNNVQSPAHTLATRPVTVRLTTEAPPAVVERDTPGGPVFKITRPPGVTGTLRWVTYADCGFLTTPTYSTYNMYFRPNWVPTGPHLAAGCRPVHSWHATLGYLNHPVTSIDYVPPVPSPSPTAGGTG